MTDVLALQGLDGEDGPANDAPANVAEIGSGFTSQVSLAACC